MSASCSFWYNVSSPEYLNYLERYCLTAYCFWKHETYAVILDIKYILQQNSLSWRKHFKIIYNILTNTSLSVVLWGLKRFLICFLRYLVFFLLFFMSHKLDFNENTTYFIVTILSMANNFENHCTFTIRNKVNVQILKKMHIF